jgi:hypothetical protein
MAGDPFDIWNDRKVTVMFRTGKGKKHLKGKHDPNMFQLLLKEGVGGTGGSARPFKVVCLAEELPEYWNHVVLQPMGDRDPPAPNDLLPPIGELTEDHVMANLEDIIDEANLHVTRMMRLEGYIPVSVTGKPDDPKLDEVRLVYLKGVLKDKNSPNDPLKRRDFVYINFRTVMGGGTQPNGAGSGPPDG